MKSSPGYDQGNPKRFIELILNRAVVLYWQALARLADDRYPWEYTGSRTASSANSLGNAQPI